MFGKILHFLKYNNLTIFLILAIFVFGGGVFAQTPTGQEFIGTKSTNILGLDNRLLLESDLDNLDMDFKIEKIEEDEKYYYVTYTYLDLIPRNQAWQYQVSEAVRKISKKSRVDIGDYLSEELSEQYEARIKELKREKKIAQTEGEITRVEVEEYDGLIGQTLSIASKVFPDYEPVVKKELPTPTVPPTVLTRKDNTTEVALNKVADIDLVYEAYVRENDPDGDSIFGLADNCPNISNPDQEDQDLDGIGDICDMENELIVDDFYVSDATSTEATITDEEIGDSNNDQGTSSEEVIQEEQVSTTSEEIVEKNDLETNDSHSAEATRDESQSVEFSGDESSTETEFGNETTDEYSEEVDVEIIEL